jgi:ribosomal-protein-alanine N-acetyltransferase
VKNFNPILETKRLILRKITLDDVQDIFEYASDKEIDKYISWDYHKSVDDTNKYINDVLQKYSDDLPSAWGVIHKQKNKLIGTCGYLIINQNHKFAEIGYVLSRKYWNKGFVTEAVGEVIKYSFERLNLNRIQIHSVVENIASSRVAEKVGMKFEGILRERFIMKGEFVNVKIYSILKKEWMNKNPEM